MLLHDSELCPSPLHCSLTHPPHPGPGATSITWTWPTQLPLSLPPEWIQPAPTPTRAYSGLKELGPVQRRHQSGAWAHLLQCLHPPPPRRWGSRLLGEIATFLLGAGPERANQAASPSTTGTKSKAAEGWQSQELPSGGQGVIPTGPRVTIAQLWGDGHVRSLGHRRTTSGGDRAPGGLASKRTLDLAPP